MRMRAMGIMMLSLLVICLAACSSGANDGQGKTAAGGDSAGSGNGNAPAVGDDAGNGNASSGGAAAGNGSGSSVANETPDGSEAGANTGSAANGGDAPAKGGKTTIVVRTFWPDARFDEAKKKYEALHPNVEIELANMPTDDAHVEADLEKFRTTTNTAMLAGKGPDLLEMKELPLDDYVRQGLLVNLDMMIAGDATFKKEDYFSNILDNDKTGGGLYAMPLSFFLSGLIGDEDALKQQGVTVDDSSWSWSDFAETGKKLVNGVYPHVINTLPEYMLNWLVTDNYSLFVDTAGRKANFDSPAFTELMEQVKEMGDDGIIGQSRPYFYPSQINSPGDYLIELKSYLSKHMKLYVKPHAKDVAPGGYFQPYLTLAINAKSKVRDQAWDFVKFMMSDQIETKPTTAGFPINRKAFAAEMEQLKKEGSVPTVKEGPLGGEPVPVDETKLAALESDLTGAIHPVRNKPDKIQEIVTEESKAYFSGQKSAEAVAKLIQNKVTTYLNE